MPRRPRFDPPHGHHHVWNRGVAQSDVFFADTDRIDFEQQLHRMHELFGIETYAYCLMDNHFHLLLHCPDGHLSRGMQRLGTDYTRHVNDRVHRDGPLFRGRFSSRLVSTDEDLVGVVRYIHRNALDVHGVSVVEGYRWSSHRAYLGHRTAPAWLNTSPVLGYFDDDPDALHRFVSAAEAVTDARVSEGV